MNTLDYINKQPFNAAGIVNKGMVVVKVVVRKIWDSQGTSSPPCQDTVYAVERVSLSQKDV